MCPAIPPKRPRIQVRGSVYVAQEPVYAPLLKPIVLLKKIFSALYHLLLAAVWSELVEAKQTDSVAAALLFLLLCIFSLIFYRFEAYQYPITIALLLVWAIDRQIALHQLHIAAAQSIIGLHGSEDWLIWDQQLPDGQHNHLKLNQTEIEQITVSRTEIYGGVFAEPIGRVWQVNLRLCDATELVVDQQRLASPAFQVAQSLAEGLSVPLRFQQSQGQGRYAWEPVEGGAIDRSSPKTFPKTVQVQKNAQQWRIASCWRWGSGWRLIKQMVQKTGFLLFVLWMSNFLVYWGAFLHFLLLSTAADSELDLLNLLIPEWQGGTGLEIGFVLVVLLVQGAKLSFEEHLLLNRSHLTVYRNRKRLAQIPLDSITATLFVKQPDPVILILGDDWVIEIDGLQQEIEFRAMLLALDQAIVDLRTGG